MARPWVRRVVEIAAVLALCAAVNRLCLRFWNALSHGESLSNWGYVTFFRSESYADALATYPLHRPAGYPTLLWLVHAAGLPVERTNEALFLVSIAGVWLLARRALTRVHPFWPTLLHAAGTFNYFNLSQYSDEALCLPLFVFLVLFALRYAERPTATRLAPLTALATLAPLVRTFSVFWLVPIAGLVVLVRSSLPMRTRILHVAAFCLTVALVNATWAAYVYHRTGFLTGMDRTSYATRPVDTGFRQQFAEMATASQNAQRIPLGTFVDFFDPKSVARREVLDAGAQWTSRNVLALGALLAAAGTLAVAFVRGRRASRAEAPPGGILERLTASPLALTAACFVLHSAAMLLVWTFGNNDPICTRFLLPSYPFLILAVTIVFDRAREDGASFAMLLPARAVYLLVLYAQVRRDMCYAGKG